MIQKKIACLGGIGSFSYLAVKNEFGEDFDCINCQKPEQIFDRILEYEADFGVLPIENTLGGSVAAHFDLLYKNQEKIKIIQEVSQQIEHSILGLVGADLETIDTVFGHYQSFLQCKKFFDARPNIKHIQVANTVVGLERIIKERQRNMAAIAHQEVAELFVLNVLKADIQDSQVNFTRFAILAPNSFPDREQPNKCSIAFVLKHQPKSLLQAIERLSQGYVNLTKIESRPIPGTLFEYIFYVDFEFEPKNLKRVQQILDKLAKVTMELKILGFYVK